MRNKFKQFILAKLNKIWSPLLPRLGAPLFRRLDCQDEMVRLVAKENLKNRAIIKFHQRVPINVLFVCHERALWSSFETIYQAMENDPLFNPTILALPYKHPTLSSGDYHDSGVVEFMQKRGFSVIEGYDQASKRWKTPSEFSPDFTFFQTPYNLFPPEWSSEQVSMITRICYVPYACNIFGGAVDKIAHPPSYFKNVSIVLKEGEMMRDVFVEKFHKYKWFDESKVIVSGYPKLDKLRVASLPDNKIQGQDETHQSKVLWTPRWRTTEGNCHFFDYKNFLRKYFSKHSELRFVFRPHPLCFQNFIKTGEMSPNELIALESEYIDSENMDIDMSGSYEEVFLDSDILISDISSLLLEYFVTGKPIIYTHKVDCFNDLGRVIAQGFYWVRNERELDETLTMLASGEDPLFNVRQDLVQSIFAHSNEVNAGCSVKNVLLENFAKEAGL